MRTSFSAIAALACLAGSTGCQLPAASAADAQAGMAMDTGSTSAAPSAQPGGGGEAMFQTVQKLVGRWQARLPNGKMIVDTFQPFGAGAYMLHEEWVDGKQITSSVFYMVGSQLWVDHFCDYLNQPRYTAKPSADPSVVDLEFRGATDLDAHPRHFHSTVWRLVDATHMTQDWDVRGGPKGEVHVHLDFTRTSPSV
jgi:hypothetical protein